MDAQCSLMHGMYTDLVVPRYLVMQSSPVENLSLNNISSVHRHCATFTLR